MLPHPVPAQEGSTAIIPHTTALCVPFVESHYGQQVLESGPVAETALRDARQTA